MSDLYDDITSQAQKELDEAKKEYQDGLNTFQSSKMILKKKY